MIVVLSSAADPQLIEADNLGALSVQLSDPVDEVRLGTLATVDSDGDHVWLDVGELGAMVGTDRADDYGRMIDYASSKGWTQGDPLVVRAHIESGR